jgi:integral membrane protein
VTPHPRTLFRTVAIAEACSWAGLLVGMFFKHVVRSTAVGVQVFGPIHGVIFVAYLVSILVVRRPLRWSLRTVLVAAVASIPPFATLAFEVWADRRGRLTPAPEARREPVPTPV